MGVLLRSFGNRLLLFTLIINIIFVVATSVRSAVTTALKGSIAGRRLNNNQLGETTLYIKSS